MSEIEKRIAENKAKVIISSCVTVQHFSSARNYIELFNKRFNDKEAYERLWDHWKTSLN